MWSRGGVRPVSILKTFDWKIKLSGGVCEVMKQMSKIKVLCFK